MLLCNSQISNLEPGCGLAVTREDQIHKAAANTLVRGIFVSGRWLPSVVGVLGVAFEDFSSETSPHDRFLPSRSCARGGVASRGSDSAGLGYSEGMIVAGVEVDEARLTAVCE